MIDKIDDQLADFRARYAAIEQLLAQWFAAWRTKPPRSPPPCRRLYADDDATAADEAGLSMSDYVRDTLR